MSIEKLEDRNLLAAVSFDSGSGLLAFTADTGQADIVSVSSPSADVLQIQVGNGDSIALTGDAAGNADFVLSQNAVANDTLQVDLGSSVVSAFFADLGDLDDIFTVSASSGISSFTVVGGDGADSIDASLNDGGVSFFGNAGNDTLTGGSGNDILAGGGGTDTIDGGDGIDTNSFQGIGLGVTATVAADGTGTASYGGVNETFAGIENLTGSENNDILTATGAAANVLRGEGGDDILAGGGGTDVIDGGDGIDTNSFQGIGLGVTATVAADGTGTASYGSVSETFAGIENLTGSENDDVLIATGAAANVLRGEGGDDILAGGGGTDVIDGGDGIDTNSFFGIGLGVTATINADGTGTAAYGPVNESFVSIENLTGSDNNDTLTGNGFVNVIDGGLGDDTINGLGGDDLLFGGSGVDTINGGDGNDRIVGGFGDDLLNGNAGDDSLIGGGQIEVTLTNLGGENGSLLTPVVVATQNGIYDQFDVGSAASENIERLAEDGTTGPRIAAALGSGGVGEAIATSGGPIAPGESRTLTFFADPTDPQTQYLSYASMVIPSNDAFIGNDNPLELDLFDDSGSLIRRVGSNAYIVTGDDVYDAGTEVNDEIPANTAALAQAAPNTGTTEGGVIRQHEGFQGSERLGGPTGNILTARPGSDFTVEGSQILSIEVDSAARELGFSIEVVDQPLASLTTPQSSEALLTEAANDNLYFNVHTSNVPSGEIRGQLLLQSDNTIDGVRTLVLTASLDSAQEPGGTSDSLATGQATVTIVDDGGSVTYSSSLSIEGLVASDLLPVAGVSSIHLHNAPAGSNGPVIVDIVQDAGGDVNGAAQSVVADTGDGNVFVELFESDNDVLNGGEGVDSLIGGDGDDVLNGGAGNDRLFGNNGNDILRGNGGDDTAEGGAGDDALNGGSGNDTLNGNDGDDFFVGIGGTDSIDGGAGNDTNSFQGIGLAVTATVNADGTGTASYGQVNEVFAGIENLTGSANDDILRAVGDADNVLQGLDGNDLLEGGDGDDTLVGNDGDDILRGGNGDDVILGLAGDDAHNGGAGDDILIGAAGNDFFVGIGGTDFVDGGAGFDTNSFQGIGVGVTARVNDDGTGLAQYGMVNESFAGIERLVGSSNDDILIATGSRNTQLLGLEGDDLLIGGAGDDVLIGGAGDDTLNGRGGNDLLFGELGNDTLNGGAGDDFARGDQGDDTISGGSGNDRLVGSEGNDFIFGNAGIDFIVGGDGFDSLFGGDDDDEIRGNDGDDLLIGGLGIDVLFGGLGDDQEIQ